MKPSVKSERMEDAITGIFGHDRREAIYQNKCAPSPIGCGKDIFPELDFRNAISAKEFTISGLCQSCQDTVFGYDEPDVPSSHWMKPREYYTPTANDFVVTRRGMVSGQGEAQSRRYHKHVGKSGKIWLVADQENAAANIYIEGNTNSDGFGGATLTFPLVDGGEVRLKGPWHSGPDSLYSDTGVDVRDKHLTFVVVSCDRKSGKDYESIMVDVLYKDEAPVLGIFDRGKEIAQRIANERQEQVFLYSESEGGSSCGPVKPMEV